ncbi:MAG: hypothetical protein FWE37_05305 [Spirochaetaceae bacterium]|nr:hypothetical protein [Spirochaetaceae bacterium]
MNNTDLPASHYAPLDEEEAQYMKELENGEWKSIKKPITIRLDIADILAAKKRASDVGIPYQTLIASLVHRYLKGDIKLENPM